MADSAAPTLAEGRYTIVRQLGEGGMATVFLAWDGKLKVWRAVKVLLPDFVRKSKVRRRFENEAHAMARLEHPHIIRVYDVGLQQGSPYLVMEFARGGCVIDWLDTYGPMPARMAADVVMQISKGIHAAHEAGIVHRDIKPHNILVTHKGVCKMTDFGIAQVMENDSLTKTGSVMGTWGYMAPEQRTDSKAVDERADIFGLGATLYAMLTNKTPTELYVADEEDGVFEGIEPAMLAVILKACSYKATQRFSSVKAFSQAVSEAGASSGPLPEDTAPLILPSAPLPESIESVRLEAELVESLADSLGLNPSEDSDEPTLLAKDSRVLPYYDQKPSLPEADGNVEFTPDQLASYFEAEMPQVDADLFEPTPPPQQVFPDLPRSEKPSFEERVPEEQVEEKHRAQSTMPIDILPEIQAEVPEDVSVVDWALRLSVIPLVMGIFLLLVVGWGMVSVNGAHDKALQASRPLHALLNDQVQGPIIDGLALNGGDKAGLEKLLETYRRGDGDRMKVARAYVRTVNEQSRINEEGAVVEALLPSIRELSSAERMYANAEEDWRASSYGFPGILAVTIGLSEAPSR